MRSLTRKFSPKTDTVKDENGTLLCESDDVKERWKHYCCYLYKKNRFVLERAPLSSYDNIAEPTPLYSEVEKLLVRSRIAKALE